MSKSQKIFFRKEKQYLLPPTQYQNITRKLEQYMEQDAHGLHTICSLYYYTNDYELIRASIEKPIYKEKFRVRSYGISKKDSQVFIELKKKFDGVVDKKRMELTNSEVQLYLAQSTIFSEEIADNENYCLMEVKSLGGFSVWLSRILSDG